MVATTAVCPVCAGADTTELGHQPAVPTNNAILCDDAVTALAWPLGSFRLTLCRSCGFFYMSNAGGSLDEVMAEWIKEHSPKRKYA